MPTPGELGCTQQHPEIWGPLRPHSYLINKLAIDQANHLFFVGGPDGYQVTVG